MQAASSGPPLEVPSSSQQVSSSTLASLLASMLAGPGRAPQSETNSSASNQSISGGGGGGGYLEETTEASVLRAMAAALTAATASSETSSGLAISEQEELKLLNFPSKREDLSTAIPLTVIFGLLLVTGCVGNICTAIVIARPKNKYMHTATNYYLFSLAISDFLFLILGLPQEMYTLWQRYPYAFGESFCIIRGYLSEASTYASILTISAFTVERYVAICHPLWAHTMSQLPRAITSIVIIWCLAALCAIPPAAELGIVTQQGPVTNRTLSQSAQCAQKRTIYENMFVVSAIVFFIVPMIIVTVLYILIAIELRRSSRMNNAISKQTSSHLSNSSSGHHHHSHSHHHHHHHHNHHHSAHHHHPHTHHNHNYKTHHHHQPQHDPQNCNHKHHCHVHALRNPHIAGQKPLAALSPSSSSSLQMITSNGGLLAGGHLLASERPSSAIGTELQVSGAATPNCCQAPEEARPASALASSLARLQRIPSASKLCGHLLLMGGWSSSQAHLQVSEGDECRKRSSASALSCQVAIDETSSVVQNHNNNNNSTRGEVGDLRQGSLQTQGGGANTATGLEKAHESLSRQHSPLSYHESLMQKHHHSALDMNSNGLCSRSFHHNHGPPAHHQLSLTNLPVNQQPGRQHAGGQHHAHPHHSHHSHHPHHHHHNHHNHHNHQSASQQSRRSNAASSKKSVIRMLVAVVVSFFICWSPFHAQRLLASYLVKDENQNQLLLDIYLKLTYISGVMYYLSSTINPLLYQLMSAKFRLAFKETFKCSLFTCAIFRRASTATTMSVPQTHFGGTTAHAVGHSPTNSVKAAAAAVGFATTNRHSSCHCCQCQLAVRRQNNQTHNETSRTHAGEPMKASASAADLHSNNNGEQSACCSATCCCCCCGGGSFLNQHLPGGVLNRFRGRLNASLTSLFRSSQDQPAGCEPGQCSCLRTGGGRHAHARPPGARAGPATGGSGLASGRASADEGQAGAQQQPQQRDCPSAPLLALNADGEPAVQVVGGGCQQGGKSHQQQPARPLHPLQTSFPGHHTMLKFVRSPTPSGGGGGGGPNHTNGMVTSLTRLSSREDEQLSATQEEVELEHAPRDEPRPAGDAMGALIRRASERQVNGGSDENCSSSARSSPSDEPLQADESELLLGPGGVAGSSNSAGSSPDQLGGGATTSTMSSASTARSSLALLGAERVANPRPPEGPVGTGRRQPLLWSKSAGQQHTTSCDEPARANGRKSRQHPRRRSLQQAQQQQRQLAAKLGDELDDAASPLCPSSSLSSSELHLAGGACPGGGGEGSRKASAECPGGPAVRTDHEEEPEKLSRSTTTQTSVILDVAADAGPKLGLGQAVRPIRALPYG